MAKFGGGGFGGGMNMQAMMKQAQKMQEQMQKAQEQLEEAEIEGSAGGELVRIVLNGKKRVLGIAIDPKVCDPEDIEMLEDLIVAAFNDAAEKAEALESELMPAGL